MKGKVDASNERVKEKIMIKEPYLKDAQVGDVLYNFIKKNREYRVIRVTKDKIKVKSKDGCSEGVWITKKGSYYPAEFPCFLYAPVKVLDPGNLPPRPKPRFVPKENEPIIVWEDGMTHGAAIRIFVKMSVFGRYLCKTAFDLEELKGWKNAMPFTGELPDHLRKVINKTEKTL